jgi:hypothetical protein
MDTGMDRAATANALEKNPPAYWIPPEIIAMIIRELLPKNIYSVEGRIDALRSATSICRYWRYAALNDASLWSVIPAFKGYLRRQFLQRSRNMPLSVVFHSDAFKPCPAQKMTVSLLPHAQRIKNAMLAVPIRDLNMIFSALERHGTRLDDILIHLRSPPTDEEWTTIFGHLSKHAPTLKFLKLKAEESIPSHQLQRFPCLSHLKLRNNTCDLQALSYLLTSFPTLVSIKLYVQPSVGGPYHPLSDRIVPHPNLRSLHLDVRHYPLKVVLDSLKIRAGVHLQCNIVMNLYEASREPASYLPLPLKFFENTSNVETLTIGGFREFKCSGSGPSGSFCIKATPFVLNKPPLEDFLSLRKLVVTRDIDQELLEGIVVSAPRLTWLTFDECAVCRSWKFDSAIKKLPRIGGHVGVVQFLRAMWTERAKGAKLFNSITVSGTLEGDHLNTYRSIVAKPI